MTDKTVNIIIRAPESFRRQLTTAARKSDNTQQDYALRLLQAGVAKTLNEVK